VAVCWTWVVEVSETSDCTLTIVKGLSTCCTKVMLTVSPLLF
jgi:hypothetical protein